MAETTIDPRAVPVLAARVLSYEEANEIMILGYYLQRIDEQHIGLAVGYWDPSEDGWRWSWATPGDAVAPGPGDVKLIDILHEACIDMTEGGD